jgi:hypothetical protein
MVGGYERVQMSSEVLMQQLEYLAALAKARHFGRAAAIEEALGRGTAFRTPATAP